MRIGKMTFLSVTLCLAVTNGHAQHSAGETFKDCETCPDMVVIPPGTFTMGS